MGFSADAKFIVTQTGAPDWNLQYWSWEKAKVLATIRTVNPPEKAVMGRDPLFGQVVYQCAINPSDNSHVSVIGNGIFKMFRLSEGIFKVQPTGKIEQKVHVIAYRRMSFVMLGL